MMAGKAYTKPRLLYDGLGYFVVLTGTLLLWLVAPHPTVLRAAINLVNLILYRQTNPTIQTSGYLPSILE